MSWQTYVDDHLMCQTEEGGPQLSSAAIIGHDGAVWAQSASFPQVLLLSFLFILCIFVEKQTLSLDQLNSRLIMYNSDYSL